MTIKAKVSDFIPDVRRITRDTDAASPYRTDADICRAVVDAIRHMRAVRPEARYDDECRLSDVAFPADADALAAFEVSLNEAWRLGVAYYASARCYEADVTDSVSLQLAQTYFKRADEEFAR